jgi:hypothetical protein
MPILGRLTSQALPLQVLTLQALTLQALTLQALTLPEPKEQLSISIKPSFATLSCLLARYLIVRRRFRKCLASELENTNENFVVALECYSTATNYDIIFGLILSIPHLNN